MLDPTRHRWCWTGRNRPERYVRTGRRCVVVASFLIAFLPADLLGALARESPAHPDRAKLLGTILISLMVYGALLLISGGVSPWLYLRRTRPAAQEGQ